MYGAMREEVSGAVERVRKSSAKEVGGKDCKDSMEKMIMKRLHAS